MGDHQASVPVAVFETEASMDQWEVLNEFVEQHANQHLGVGKQSYSLRLACEELFSNIIRHSRDDGRDTPVTLSLQFFLLHEEDDGSALMIQIQDNGPFFDPHLESDRVIPSHLSAADRPIGGLGLFLVQQSVDRLDYAWIDQKNCYRLFVNLNQATEDAR
jgi:serine/threonine-protein kinase RsbW